MSTEHDEVVHAPDYTPDGIRRYVQSIKAAALAAAKPVETVGVPPADDADLGELEITRHQDWAMAQLSEADKANAIGLLERLAALLTELEVYRMALVIAQAQVGSTFRDAMNNNAFGAADRMSRLRVHTFEMAQSRVAAEKDAYAHASSAIQETALTWFGMTHDRNPTEQVRIIQAFVPDGPDVFESVETVVILPADEGVPVMEQVL